MKITAQIKKIIEGNVVSLATADKKGNPNVIAVFGVKVIFKNQLIITDVYMKQTINNLMENNNVCLAVWDKKWQGYKLVGTAEYFPSGKWKKFVQELPENKNMPVKGAILVTVSKIIPLK